MILLITPSARGQECATAVEMSTAESTHLASSLHEAATRLRSQEYSAVVVDQSLLEADPDQGDLVLQHIGTAIPVYVNCAISGTHRVVRELKAALHRRTQEGISARKAAEQVLRSELREPLTALLLDCELALSLPNLPALAKEKIRAVDSLARRIAEHLQIEPPVPAGN